MRNLTPSFTMRRDGVLPRGDWFKFEDKTKEDPKVYIYDEIGFWGTSASDFVEQLNEIKADKVELHLNSPGGEIFDGLAIYNAIKQHKAEFTGYVDGLAASAASFIAQACDKLVMARNAQMMIHDGIAFAYGNEQDMLDTAAVLSNLSDNIADIYAQAAKRRGFDATFTKEYYRGLMRAELWTNGQEAVTFGLADEVTDADEDEADEAMNKWDLGTVYNHAGRERAESPLRIQEKIRLANNTKDTKMSQGSDTAPEPTTPAPESTDTPVEEPKEPDTNPVTTTPAGDPAPAALTPAPENKAGLQGVMINGKLETDWAVINRHFETLNAAQDEQRATFRKKFIENLATENKISAPQIDKLVELVNGTDTVPAMSDEQFAAFSASYESAPASSVLGQQDAPSQPGQPGNTAQPGQMTAEQRQDRINVLEGTVAMHRRTMDEDSVQNTKSYKELQTLLAENA